MTLKDIYSISGHPGLFKYIAQGRNGIIVEGIEDKKRLNAFASMKVSSLGEISVYTNTGDMPLLDVLRKIRDKDSGAAAPDPKADNKTVQDYFAAVLPEFDNEKVHVSDIRKMISWYNLLQRNDLLGLLDASEEEKTTDTKTPDDTTEKTQ